MENANGFRRSSLRQEWPVSVVATEPDRSGIKIQLAFASEAMMMGQPEAVAVRHTWPRIEYKSI
mgnify:CR=1 FL=1